MSSLPELPGNPIVVNYAPQLELLKIADLTITHAGVNTTLESLSNGVPLVAIPITNDQPGVAARNIFYCLIQPWLTAFRIPGMKRCFLKLIDLMNDFRAFPISFSIAC